MSWRDGPRWLSYPLGIEWAGWRSDTRQLQGSGWDMAVEFDPYGHRYRLLLKHQAMSLHAMTDELTLERFDVYEPRMADYPIFQVVSVARVLHAHTSVGIDFSKFQQIDATPQIVSSKIQSVEDFNIFALARQGAKEIMVDQADMSVIEHLEAIKRLQQPKQHELRQRMLRDETPPQRETPRLHLVANLVELAA